MAKPARTLAAAALLMVSLASQASTAPLFPYEAFDAGARHDLDNVVTSLAVADLNGDGRQDYVVARQMGLIAVLATGEGKFTTFGTVPLGGLHSLAVADLNMDGQPDIAGVAPPANAVLVMLGNGDGTFRGSPTRLTSSDPRAMVVADLNADGRPDVVVANHGSASVSTFLGVGDGTFGARTDFSTGSGPTSVAVGDLNGDGRPDLVVANALSGTVSILLGHGNGTFDPNYDLAAGPLPVSIAIADLNGDGHQDIAVANESSGTVSILVGHSDGTFESKRDLVVTPEPTALSVADLNGDGRPDIVLAGSNGLSAMLGSGGGVFEAPVVIFCAGGPQFAISDVDGDGRQDLAVAVGDRVVLIPGNADGTLPIVPSFPTALDPRSVVMADINADGRPDLAVDCAGDTISVLLGDGHGAFNHRIDVPTGVPHVLLGAADFNGDGWPDLLTSNDQGVALLEGNGDGTFRSGPSFGWTDDIHAIAIADLNADGRPDIAMASYGLEVFLGNGDGTFAHRTILGGLDCFSIAVADLNSDGRPDVAMTTSGPLGYSDKVSVFLGNGDGTFQARTEASVGYPAGREAIADLDGDGRADLAVADGPSIYPTEGDPPILVLPGNGDGTFGSPTVVGHARADMLAIADLSADGSPDIVAWSGIASVLVGKGNSAFDTKTHYGNTPGVIGDLNGDGWPDLAMTGYQPSAVSVFLNHSAPGTPLAVEFDLAPGTLNISSRARWVTGFLEPAAPLLAADIDVSSIRLNGTVPVAPAAPTAIGDHDSDGIPDLMVKFDRVALELTLPEGDDVPVEVTGAAAGHAFAGTALLRVHRGTVSAPAAGSHLSAGIPCQVRWETPPDPSVEMVALLQSLDGGSTWTRVAGEQPNCGTYGWTVPSTASDKVRVAVVTGSADATANGVLAMSGRFSIEATVEAVPPVPAPVALAVRATTTNGRLRVQFALPNGGPARLQVADVSGRMVRTIEVGDLGPGTHSLDLGINDGLRSGIYFLRLTQGGSQVRARAAMVK